MTELPEKSLLKAQLRKELEIAKQQFGDYKTEIQ